MPLRILILYLSICLAMTGCGAFSPVKLLDEMTAKENASDSGSVMLINLTQIYEYLQNGAVVPVFNRTVYRMPDFGDIGTIEVTDLFKGVPPIRIDPVFSTSDEDIKKGWILFNLDPGRYYIELGNGLGCKYHLGITIPSGKHIYYLGAYRWLNLSKMTKNGDFCQLLPISSDEERQHALALAETYFASLGPLVIGMPESSLESPLPMALIHQETSVLEPYEWVSRSATRAASGVPPICIGTGGSLADIPLTAICIVSGLATLTAAGIGSISGNLEKNRWRACESNITKALNKIDLPALARNAIQNSLKANGLSPKFELSSNLGYFEKINQEGVRTVLELRFTKFRWRENGEDLFLSANVDGILWDIPSRSSFIAWSFSVEDAEWPTKRSRSMSALCEGNIDQLVSDEVSHLFEALVARIGSEITEEVKANLNSSLPNAVNGVENPHIDSDEHVPGATGP